MPQSHSKILLHIAFSTKNRRASLTPSTRSGLYPYAASVLKNLECPATEIGGTEDHLHLLCGLPRTLSVAQLVEGFKKPTSKWLKAQGVDFGKFQWQSGYAAFSVSPSLAPRVAQYIQKQEEHHQKVDFKDEFRKLLAAHNIAYDEEYVWD